MSKRAARRAAPPITLVSRPERQKEGIVALLESMLEAARRGEYRSFMAVAEWDSTGDLTWCWSANDDLPGFAAKLDLLKQQTYRRLFRDTSPAR